MNGENLGEFSARDLRAEDVPFIYATWLKAQRRVGHFDLMTSKVYFANQKTVIDRILERASVLVLSDSKDLDFIVAYLVSERMGPLVVIHYAHVKEPFRKMGIMSGLIRAAVPEFGKQEIAITATTEQVQKRANKYALKFNPYLIEGVRNV